MAYSAGYKKITDCCRRISGDLAQPQSVPRRDVPPAASRDGRLGQCARRGSFVGPALAQTVSFVPYFLSVRVSFAIMIYL